MAEPKENKVYFQNYPEHRDKNSARLSNKEESVIRSVAERTAKNTLSAIKDELKELYNKIGCPLGKEARSEAPHLFGAIKDIGDDNISQGIDNIRESHKYTVKFMELNRSVIGTVVRVVVGAIVVGILGILAKYLFVG